MNHFHDDEADIRALDDTIWLAIVFGASLIGALVNFGVLTWLAFF